VACCHLISIVPTAQYGEHNEKRSSYGHAMIVDPWGTVVSDLGPEGSGVGISDVDSELMERVRTRMPVMSHRRRDILAIEIGENGTKLKKVSPNGTSISSL